MSSAGNLDKCVQETPTYSKPRDCGIRTPEYLLCPVCRDVFNDPRLLPCSHTLCQQCVRSVIQKSTDDAQISVLCPICKANHLKSSLFETPKNRAIEDAIEDWRRRNAKAKRAFIKCQIELCKSHSKEANIWCETCKRNICVDCTKCKLDHKRHIFDNILDFNKFCDLRSQAFNICVDGEPKIKRLVDEMFSVCDCKTETLKNYTLWNEQFDTLRAEIHDDLEGKFSQLQLGVDVYYKTAIKRIEQARASALKILLDLVELVQLFNNVDSKPEQIKLHNDSVVMGMESMTSEVRDVVIRQAAHYTKATSSSLRKMHRLQSNMDLLDLSQPGPLGEYFTLDPAFEVTQHTFTPHPAGLNIAHMFMAERLGLPGHQMELEDPMETWRERRNGYRPNPRSGNVTHHRTLPHPQSQQERVGNSHNTLGRAENSNNPTTEHFSRETDQTFRRATNLAGRNQGPVQYGTALGRRQSMTSLMPTAHWPRAFWSAPISEDRNEDTVLESLANQRMRRRHQEAQWQQDSTPSQLGLMQHGFAEEPPAVVQPRPRAREPPSRSLNVPILLNSNAFTPLNFVRDFNMYLHPRLTAAAQPQAELSDDEGRSDQHNNITAPSSEGVLLSELTPAPSSESTSEEDEFEVELISQDIFIENPSPGGRGTVYLHAPSHPDMEEVD